MKKNKKTKPKHKKMMFSLPIEIIKELRTYYNMSGTISEALRDFFRKENSYKNEGK